MANFSKNQLHELAKSKQDNGCNIFCGLRTFMAAGIFSGKGIAQSIVPE